MAITSAEPISEEEMAGMMVKIIAVVFDKRTLPMADGNTVTFGTPATGQSFRMTLEEVVE